MIWVVTCDKTICLIYQYDKPHKLSLLKEISHPENKLKDSELTSDKPGRYKSGSSAHGTYSQDTDPKMIKIVEFYREIARELDQGRTNNHYKQIILISSAQTSGILFQHLNKHVKELISKAIHKDLLHLSEQELLDFLKENIKYQGD